MISVYIRILLTCQLISINIYINIYLLILTINIYLHGGLVTILDVNNDHVI